MSEPDRPPAAPQSSGRPDRPAQVRLALPAEAEAMAALQRRCWDSDQEPALSSWLLGQVDLTAMTESWHGAVTRPPDARCRVLVAVTGRDEPGPGAVAGFVTTQPSQDPDADPGQDGELGEWLVDPVARGRGHGSRLLNAAIDTLRADGFTRATTWVASTDDVRRRVLSESGWAADGAHRTIGPSEDLGVKQVRLHTQVTD